MYSMKTLYFKRVFMFFDKIVQNIVCNAFCIYIQKIV